MPLPLDDKTNPLYDLGFLEQCQSLVDFKSNNYSALKLFSLTESHTEKELKVAYWQLSFQFHPDKHQSAQEQAPASEAFKIISSANEYLKFNFLSDLDKAEARTAHRANPFYKEPPLFSTSFKSGFTRSYDSKKPFSFNDFLNPKKSINHMTYEEIFKELSMNEWRLNQAMINRFKVLITQDPSLLRFTFTAKHSFRQRVRGVCQWQRNIGLSRYNLLRLIQHHQVDFFDYLIEQGQSILDYDINYILIELGEIYLERGILKDVLHNKFIKTKVNIYNFISYANRISKLALVKFLFNSSPLELKAYFTGVDYDSDIFSSLSYGLGYNYEFQEHRYSSSTVNEILQILDLLLDNGFRGDLSSLILSFVLTSGDVTRVRRLINLGATLSITHWYDLFKGMNSDRENFNLALTLLKFDFNTDDAYEQAKELLFNHGLNCNGFKAIHFLKALAKTNMSQQRQRLLHEQLLASFFIDNNNRQSASEEFEIALYILELRPELVIYSATTCPDN